LDVEGRLSRVQVKSITNKDPSRNDRYRFLAAHGRTEKKPYTKKDIDFVACYVFKYDTWYIIPIEEIKTMNVSVYPHRAPKAAMFERFKDAWHLLKN